MCVRVRDRNRVRVCVGMCVLCPEQAIMLKQTAVIKTLLNICDLYHLADKSIVAIFMTYAFAAMCRC